MITENVVFTDSHGNKLSGILSTPEEGTHFPIVIYTAGLRGNKNGTGLILAELANENNRAFFRFDTYGHGESEGKLENLTLSIALDGYLHAIDRLKQRGFTTIGLSGVSYSGNLAFNAAAQLGNEIVGLFGKCPVSDYREKMLQQHGQERIDSYLERGYYEGVEKGKPYKINADFYQDMPKHNVHKIANKIKVPTLIVHGDNDTTVSVEQSIKTCELIDNCNLEIITGANHSFKKPEGAFDKVNQLFVEFFRQIF